MPENSLCRIFFALVLVAAVVPAYGQGDDWQLIRDEASIKVYTAESSSSEIIRARVITEVNAPMQAVEAILDDVDGRVNWVPYLISARVLAVVNPAERIEYALFEAPWPASDRDFVYSLVVDSRSVNQVSYRMRSLLRDEMPEQAWIVRGELMQSHYQITQLAENRTRIELTYQADPKGWLPVWLINIIQRVLPYRILHNLKQQLQTTAIEK